MKKLGGKPIPWKRCTECDSYVVRGSLKAQMKYDGHQYFCAANPLHKIANIPVSKRAKPSR